MSLASELIPAARVDDFRCCKYVSSFIIGCFIFLATPYMKYCTTVLLPSPCCCGLAAAHFNDH